MTKIRNYARKDWIALDVIVKHIIKIFECQYKENKQHKKWRWQVIYRETKSLFQII